MNKALKLVALLAGLFAGYLGCLWIAPWLGISAMPPPAVPEKKAVAAKSTAAPPAPPATTPAPKPPTPPPKVLNTSFEEVEKISAAKELNAMEKGALQKFAFPPLAFRWNGRPQELAPAFIWESSDGVFHLGDHPVAAGAGGDALLEDYSGALKILMPNNGQLRMHFNVVSRIRAWAEEVQPEIKDQQIKVLIDSPRPNEVTLRMPAVGSKPARTLVVTI